MRTQRWLTRRDDNGADRGPIDHVLDLFVFAPLGLLAESHTIVPKLAEAGRQHVDNRVQLARMVGQFAVQQGKHQAAKVVAGLRANGARPRAAAPPVDRAGAADAGADRRRRRRRARRWPPARRRRRRRRHRRGGPRHPVVRLAGRVAGGAPARRAHARSSWRRCGATRWPTGPPHGARQDRPAAAGACDAGVDHGRRAAGRPADEPAPGRAGRRGPRQPGRRSAAGCCGSCGSCAPFDPASLDDGPTPSWWSAPSTT